MKERWVGTAAWNGEWGGGDVVAEDFGPENKRC